MSRLLQDVRVIVQNALRLFSEDRTGRADYALESGGQELSQSEILSSVIIAGEGFKYHRVLEKIYI